MTIRDRQRDHYERLLGEHGDDPRSLGHRDRPTQEERFARLARLFAGAPERFGVHEVGCGLGDFGAYLGAHHRGAVYSGSDVVDAFVEHCRKRFTDGEFELRDLTDDPPVAAWDYLTLSGTFNCPAGADRDAFRGFIERMLLAMYGACRIGIAYNFLNSENDWSDESLHYESIGEAAAFAQRRLSRFVEIDASGPLYEFTVRVWRPEAVAACYPGPSFERYLGRAT